MWPLLPAALACSMSVSAGPTVEQLLAACDRGEAQGNRGVDAALCEWYAAPCACKPEAVKVARWCVPSAEPVERIAAKVLAQLRTYGDLSAAVDQVVPKILARIYPCVRAPGQ